MYFKSKLFRLKKANFVEKLTWVDKQKLINSYKFKIFLDFKTQNELNKIKYLMKVNDGSVKPKHT